LQGRHAKETGPKGCELVTVEGGVISATEFVALETVRWHQMRLDASGLSSIDSLARRFKGMAEDLVEHARDKLHAVRLLIHGESPLHRLEAEQPGTITAAIQATTMEFDNMDLWIEEVRLDMRSPFDRAAAAERADAVGEVVRLVNSIGADDGAIRAWFLKYLAEMKEVPSALADMAPASLDVAAMHALLADAEASVLAQISGLIAEGTER
jgi:hypothetical protein